MSVKRNIKSQLYVVGVALLLSACSQLSPPDWVSGEPSHYPHNHYMSATGVANDMEAAKNKALSNLAKVFETNIHDFSSVRSSTDVNIQNRKETIKKDQQLVQQVHTSATKTITGARIAEVWHDKERLNYTALAVLDRSKAKRYLLELMDELDSETEKYLKLSRAQTEPLSSIVYLQRAIALQQQRKPHQDMLGVLDLKAHSLSSRWALSDLKLEQQQALSQLRITAMVNKDSLNTHMDKLEAHLKAAMVKAGFPSQQTQADYLLIAGLDVQDLGLKQGWYWLRGKLSLSLVEKEGSMRGREVWSIKATATGRAEAESRLMSQVANKLNHHIKSVLLNLPEKD